MVDMLTGEATRKQLKASADAQASNQRRSLAQMAAEQGVLDQQAASTGYKRGRGRQLLAFLDASGASSLG